MLATKNVSKRKTNTNSIGNDGTRWIIIAEPDRHTSANNIQIEASTILFVEIISQTLRRHKVFCLIYI